VQGAVATVADIDIAGDGGIWVLEVVGPAPVGVIRARGIGIRVGVVEALVEGGTGFLCGLRPGLGLEAVLDEHRGLGQSEEEGTVFFVGVISVPCSVFIVFLIIGSSIPDPMAFVPPEPGGRIVILLITFGEPGVTPGSCS